MFPRQFVRCKRQNNISNSFYNKTKIYNSETIPILVRNNFKNT